ncbi:MAG TPA: 3-phosphoshikimate 1-carboxyvinyltransferase [Candidatus Lumbricidophila sp.]|nr:3-phosphoshikimate 1-carboxyvinyltransferase [Candidatus Lumbricidophila sp.]
MQFSPYSRPTPDPLATGVSDVPEGGWRAPVAPGPIRSTVSLPGSKSLTNRELVLAALADRPSVLHAPLWSRDSELMIEGLRALGVHIERIAGRGEYGPDLRITPPDELIGSTTIDCGLAGTVMRFLPPVAALALGPTTFDGDAYARNRPMSGVIEGLQKIGVDLNDDGRRTLPFTVHGTGRVAGGELTIDASASSQFVSGLLLSAARFEHGLDLRHDGERVPSLPHIEMTVETLRVRGVEVRSPEVGRWVVAPGAIGAADIDIEPDLSNAAPFLAAAVATGGEVTITGWPATTTQVGAELEHLLPAFGATVTRDGDRLTVTGPSDGIRGVTLDLAHAGELVPNLVGLAALARETSTFTGIGHIRHHETDRVAALAAEINALGGKVTELPDGLIVEPAPLHGGPWRAYADHRMATTGAIIGLVVPGVVVDDIGCTSKTLPQFADLWERLAR